MLLVCIASFANLNWTLTTAQENNEVVSPQVKEASEAKTTEQRQNSNVTNKQK